MTQAPLADLPTLNPITVKVAQPTYWELIPIKNRAMAAYEEAYTAWAVARAAAFPNYHLLHAYFDAGEFQRYQAWCGQHPTPQPPFCAHCGADFPPNESRWCCNSECKYYLI